MTTTTDIPIWLETIDPPVPDLSLLALPGVEQMRAWVARREEQPPFGRLAGMDFTEAREDGTTFTMQPSGWLAGPKGFMHPGFIAWLADAPLATTAQVGMPAGTFSTTAELSLTFLGPVRVGGGPLTARGELRGVHGDDYLSTVAVTGGGGRLAAYGTSRCTVVRLGVPDPVPPPPVQPVYAGTDPWRRPVVGEVLSRDLVERTSGLELLRGQVAGALPLPPIHHLTGIRPTAVDEGCASFELPTGPWTQTFAGPVYGGAITFLASSAIGGSAQTLAPNAAACTSLDIKVNFLRPALPDGRPLAAHAGVLHAGRTLVVSRAEVLDADGRIVALATGSTRVG